MSRLLPVLCILALLTGRAWAISGTANQITFQNGTIAFANNPIRVNEGGTGAASFTNTNQPVIAGATSTSALTGVTAGTAGNLLVSAGASAPTWTTINLASANAVGSSILGVANGGTNLSAAADDNVMVGNGTTWQSKAVADCDDTGGNHLNYDTGTNAFSCGTSSSSSIFPVLAFGSNGDITQGTDIFASPTGQDPTEAKVQMVSPAATYRNLRCINSAIQGVGNDITITAHVGACGSQSAGSLTCTITGSASGNQGCSDTSNTAAPTAGQCIDFNFDVPATLTANARLNCVVERSA